MTLKILPKEKKNARRTKLFTLPVSNWLKELKTTFKNLEVDFCFIKGRHFFKNSD